MAFDKFGSAWREKAFYVERDEPLHVADSSHAKPQADPNPTWVAPADIHDQPEFLYDEDAVVGDWVDDGPGLIFDTTPYNHQHGGKFEAFESDLEAQQYNEVVADAPYGAEKQDTYVAPIAQDYSTRYLGNRFQGFANSGVSDVVLKRGLNGLPENNPPTDLEPSGFRRGWVEQSFVDRKFQVGERFHDRRLLTPNTAFVEANQGPVGGTSGNPFSTLSRAMTTIAQKPQLRREPPSMSESVTTDGTDETYSYDSQPSDWVL